LTEKLIFGEKSFWLKNNFCPNKNIFREKLFLTEKIIFAKKKYFLAKS